MKDFDLLALRAALDSERVARGMSWAAVGEALGVSPSTLRAFGSRPWAEGDGVLRAVSWLGRSPESFVPDVSRSAPVPNGPPGTLRFDVVKLFAAIDAAREQRRMTWSAVAKTTGVGSVSGLTRLRDGGRVAFPSVMRVLAWLDLPAADFVRIV
jgi:transcriptional regulator with XRE-family HTH domain